MTLDNVKAGVDYVVLLDLPVTLVTEEISRFATAGDLLGAGLMPYRWDPDYRPRLGILPRTGDAADVSWVDISPCFVFHPVNAHGDWQPA